MNYDLTDIKPFGVLLQPRATPFSVGDLPVDFMRELARLHHLVILRGFLAFDRADTFADYCNRWGEISLWPFGRVLELVEQENPTDHIFANGYVPLHWDGMYREQVPEFQIFHCVSAPPGGQGGRTTFSNTAIALENAAASVRKRWSNLTGVYSRQTEFYDSKTVAPLVTHHPIKGSLVMRYNEPPHENDESFVNHPTILFKGVNESEARELHKELQGALYSPENFYAHGWQTGDIVVSDNYTLLHGREAFASGAPRHLRRVHVLGQPPLNNPHLVLHA